MTVLIECQYFAPIKSYSALIAATNVDFCIYDVYRKMSFRNRCTLPAANGPINLSVPLIGGRDQKTVFRDVLIDNKTAWQKNHWRSILSVYGKSPFFNFISHELEELYHRPVTHLLEWNLACFEWTQKKLGTDIKISAEPISQLNTAKVIDLRDKIIPSTLAQQVAGSEPYIQVFSGKNGFFPNASILDLICCEGRNARFKLRREFNTAGISLP